MVEYSKAGGPPRTFRRQEGAPSKRSSSAGDQSSPGACGDEEAGPDTSDQPPTKRARRETEVGSSAQREADGGHAASQMTSAEEGTVQTAREQGSGTPEPEIQEDRDAYRREIRFVSFLIEESGPLVDRFPTLKGFVKEAEKGSAKNLHVLNFYLAFSYRMRQVSASYKLKAWWPQVVANEHGYDAGSNARKFIARASDEHDGTLRCLKVLRRQFLVPLLTVLGIDTTLESVDADDATALMQLVPHEWALTLSLGKAYSKITDKSQPPKVRIGNFIDTLSCAADVDIMILLLPSYLCKLRKRILQGLASSKA